MKKVFSILTLFLSLVSSGFSQTAKDHWVDSVFQTLTLEKKIAQTLLVPFTFKKGDDYWQKVEGQLKQQGYGGVVVTDGGAVALAHQLNHFQEHAQVPLLVSIDGDWEETHPIDSLMEFPPKIVFQAQPNDSLNQRVRAIKERQLRQLGIHINLADVRAADALRIFDFEAFAKNSPDKKRSDFLARRAFEEGYDLMVNPPQEKLALRALIRIINRNPLYKARLDASVKKILAYKYDLDLHRKKITQTEGLLQRLHRPADWVIREQIYKSAVTVVSNDGTLPIKVLDNKTFALLSIADRENATFLKYTAKYQQLTPYSVELLADTAAIESSLIKHDVIMVALHPQSEAMQPDISKWLRNKFSKQTLVVINFGDVKNLSHWGRFPSVIQAYVDDPEMLIAAAEVLFGGNSSKGKLPVAVSSFTAGTGINTPSLQRLQYTLPEAAGVDGRMLSKIESIAYEAIQNKATPGCYVLVAKDGKVIYDKAFGWQTYENQRPVDDQTIYDLASLTKVSATLQAVTFLYERGIIDLNKKASVYLPELVNTNKKDIILKDILAHQSGLFPFLLLYPQTMKDSMVLPEYYSSMQSTNYPLQIAPNLFGSPNLKDSIWQWIMTSKMIEKPVRTPYPYRYSDLGFMLLERMAERLLNQPMDDFLKQNLYEPLGAATLGFVPLERFTESRIAPTEVDKYFRRSTLIGTVHDERAAMLGGMAGHAGLFGTATDLAKLGQMLLQKGSYGGASFFKPATIELFTAKQYEPSRRGLGWDKPMHNDPANPTSRWASPLTFGHTGFTGTCLWVDPEFNLVYIFLSNRVYPDRSNKLLTLNIRSRIQDVIYESIFEYCKNNTP